MADIVERVVRSRMMSSIRGKNTKLELALRINAAVRRGKVVLLLRIICYQRSGIKPQRTRSLQSPHSLVRSRQPLPKNVYKFPLDLWPKQSMSVPARRHSEARPPRASGFWSVPGLNSSRATIGGINDRYPTRQFAD